jgi:hypothetical protein
VVPEAPVERTEAGLAPLGEGWFVLNAREACWGGYAVDETALRHRAGVQEETTDPAEAYARLPRFLPSPYRQGWLPG